MFNMSPMTAIVQASSSSLNRYMHTAQRINWTTRKNTLKFAMLFKGLTKK